MKWGLTLVQSWPFRWECSTRERQLVHTKNYAYENCLRNCSNFTPKKFYLGVNSCPFFMENITISYYQIFVNCVRFYIMKKTCTLSHFDPCKQILHLELSGQTLRSTPIYFSNCGNFFGGVSANFGDFLGGVVNLSLVKMGQER